MADNKISALAELTSIATDDEFVVVDKSDTAMAGSGTSKKITQTNLGIPVKATGAEIDTKTNDTKFVTPKALDDQTVLLKKAGGTMTGTLTLVTGTTTVAPIKMVAGTNLTTPAAGTIEYDGTDFFISI